MYLPTRWPPDLLKPEALLATVLLLPPPVTVGCEREDMGRSESLSAEDNDNCDGVRATT